MCCLLHVRFCGLSCCLLLVFLSFLLLSPPRFVLFFVLLVLCGSSSFSVVGLDSSTSNIYVNSGFYASGMPLSERFGFACWRGDFGLASSAVWSTWVVCLARYHFVVLRLLVLLAFVLAISVAVSMICFFGFFWLVSWLGLVLLSLVLFPYCFVGWLCGLFLRLFVPFSFEIETPAWSLLFCFLWRWLNPLPLGIDLAPARSGRLFLNKFLVFPWKCLILVLSYQGLQNLHSYIMENHVHALKGSEVFQPLEKHWIKKFRSEQSS